MKKKTAKRALLSSLLSMLLCVSMLVGTTFAWFTDSVTSTGNIIQSGNLNVEMYWADGKEAVPTADDEWSDASQGAIFNYELWEPGYTEVRHIKIANEGDLALKYQVSIVANGEVSDLSNVIDVYYVDPAVQVADRAALAAAPKLGTLTEVLAALGNTGYGELPAGEAHTITLALKMQESAGNEYMNKSIGSDFSVVLLATQLASESDSFDNQYDKNAINYDYEVENLADLEAAFAAGGNILLESDIEFEKIMPIDKEVYLNLNGKTITVDESTTSNTLLYVKEGGKLIIDGDGTIDLGSVSTMAIFAPYGELVINNGTFIRDEVTTVTNKTTGLFMGAKTTASKVTINGGYFDAGYYNADAADIEELLAGTKNLVETADDIAMRNNSKDANKVRVALKDNVSVLLNHSGYGSFKIYGGTFVGANPAWGDEGCMLPTTPNYLRPWSYYQGALLDGQTYNENGIVLPEGYTIDMETNADGIPVYTVTYNN